MHFLAHEEQFFATQFSDLKISKGLAARIAQREALVKNFPKSTGWEKTIRASAFEYPVGFEVQHPATTHVVLRVGVKIA